MIERPILFSAEMVRAILDGRKRQTRRVVKFPFCSNLTQQLREHALMETVYPMPKGGFVFWDCEVDKKYSDYLYSDSDDGLRCPYGEPGDQLWVRETFKGAWRFGDNGCAEYWLSYKADGQKILYKKAYLHEFENWPDKWRPSIYMPRWASRINLVIASVRVERVQDIDESDAMFEGLWDGNTYTGPDEYYRRKFAGLWDSINAKRGYGWDVNPFVWVIEFEKVGG